MKGNSCLLSSNKNTRNLRCNKYESFWIDFSYVLKDNFSLSFSFFIFVLYVSLVFTKWKWDFALPCLHRRTGDLGSFQVSCLDFCAQVFSSAWVKLTFYFLHPQGRKVFRNCILPRQKFLTKSVAMKARRDFLLYLPRHIFRLDIFSFRYFFI